MKYLPSFISAILFVSGWIYCSYQTPLSYKHLLVLLILLALFLSVALENVSSFYLKVLTSASTLLLWALWFLSSAKPGSILGHFSYFQSMGLLLVTCVLISSIWISFTPEKQRRKTLFKIVALWLGIGLPWLLGEAMFWVMPYKEHEHSPFIIPEDKVLPYVRPENASWAGLWSGVFAVENKDRDPYARQISFSTDFEGFRNNEDIRQADIVFMGDSFTEASYVAEEDTFVHVVGKKLQKTVRNLGVSGYCPTNELIVFERYGLPCKPKVVVWQLCELNDLLDELGVQQWIANGRPSLYVKRRLLGTEKRLQIQLSPFDRWKMRSPSYILFNYLRENNPWPTLEAKYYDNSGKMHLTRFTGKPKTLYQNPLQHPGWPLIVRALAKGKELMAQSGIKLIVALVPIKTRVTGHAIRPGDWTQGNFTPEEDFAPHESIAYHLNNLCDSLQIRFIDPTLELRASSKRGEMVYLPFDSHFTELGYKIVGELIAQEIEKK